MAIKLSFKRRLQLQILNGKAVSYNPYNSADTLAKGKKA